jgi:hypothetical protein
LELKLVDMVRNAIELVDLIPNRIEAGRFGLRWNWDWDWDWDLSILINPKSLKIIKWLNYMHS